MHAFPPRPIEPVVMQVFLLAVWAALAVWVILPRREARSRDPLIVTAILIGSCYFIRADDSTGLAPRFPPQIGTGILLIMFAFIPYSGIRAARYSRGYWRSFGCTLFAVAGVIWMSQASLGVPRYVARMSACRTQMRSVSWALMEAAGPKGEFLPRMSGEPPVSWRVLLLPHLEQAALLKRYDRMQPWDSAANRPLTRERVEELICPAVPDGSRGPEGGVYTGYAIPHGPGSVFADDGPKGWRELESSWNTISLVEACGQQILWTEPRDVNLQELPVGVNRPGDAPGHSHGLLSSYHPRGVHVAFFDGRVQTISEKMDPRDLEKLLRIDLGKPSSEEF